MRALLVLLLPAVLAACASQVPPAIRVAVTNAPDVQQARSATTELVGRRVRWGGVIASLENRKQDTWIVLVDRPLDSHGRPIDGDDSGGRFIARISGFLDPATYAEDREMTVAGVLAISITRDVGEYPYQYPVVDVDTFYLWAKPLPAHPYYYDPYWYDPWPGPRYYLPAPRPRALPQGSSK